MTHVVGGIRRILMVGAMLALGPVLCEAASPLLVLGPLPLPPAPDAKGPLAPKVEPVWEVEPGRVDPRAGDRVATSPGREAVWRRWNENGGGVEGPGVFWLAGRLETDRWTEVTMEAVAGPAKGELFVDGVRWGEGKAKKPLARGRHLVLVRLVLKETTPARPEIQAKPEGKAELRWTRPSPAPPADFDAMRRLRSLGPVAVSDGGALVARRISWHDDRGEGRHGRLDILAGDGRVVAASVGDGSARPLAFLSGSGAPRLLFSQRGEEGTDVLIFDPARRTVRTVIRGEPDLAFVRIGGDGRFLLVASSRGTKKPERDASAPRRRRALREKLSDYVTRRQLFLVDMASGARRLLVAAGDGTLDDAAFTADGKAVVYLRTVPREGRPWFETSIRKLDLDSGRDTELGLFVGGWEGRPVTVAPSPDGSAVAFIGPPDQVEAGRTEHNVYNRQVWLLDEATGKLTRLSPDDGPAATLGRDELLRWRPDGTALLVGVTAGSRSGLAWLARGEGGWSWKSIPLEAETVGAAAVSPDLGFAAVTASSRSRPVDLRVVDLGTGMESVLEAPNADAARGWRLARAEDLDLPGPDGDPVDGWWYRPSFQVESGKVPLIVYYYGGAVPTSRRFNTTHQVLAANGYAVLVLNPRGALGYGDAFADAHVDDWGPKASADILAAVDAFTASHPGVDAARIGIYGGSYGGFMTEYLVSHTDRFAAAVAMYGISDIASYWGAGTWGWTYGDTALAGAFPWTRPELFAGRSPLYAAGRIRTPLLLLHGEADVNVPEGESEQLYTALRTLGRNVELVTFPGEDHGIAGSWRNWVEHRRMMLEFFDRWLRGQPGAWAHRWHLDGSE